MQREMRNRIISVLIVVATAITTSWAVTTCNAPAAKPLGLSGIGGGPLAGGGGGLSKVNLDSSGSNTLTGSGSISNPLLNQIHLGAGFSGTGSAGSSITFAETGDISGVTAGSGLINGGASGAVTLDVGAGSGILVAADSISVGGGSGITINPTGIQTNLGTGLTYSAGAVVPNLAGGTCLNSRAVTSMSASGTATCGDINDNDYEGTHLEWWDEFLVGPGGAQSTSNGFLIQTLTSNGVVTAATATTGRPGIVTEATGTIVGGRAALTTTAVSVADFGSGTWTAKWVGGFPTLSTAAIEYGFITGFIDVSTSLNQVDGCYFLYDRLPAATAPGTGTITAGADKWQCWCSANSVRTGYTMDGTIVSQGSFTTVNAPVAALTWPSTNVSNLKVVVDAGAARAQFYVNGVKSCEITTNIPSGSARLAGYGFFILGSAGGTSRTVDTDVVRLSVDLTSARTP